MVYRAGLIGCGLEHWLADERRSLPEKPTRPVKVLSVARRKVPAAV